MKYYCKINLIKNLVVTLLINQFLALVSQPNEYKLYKSNSINRIQFFFTDSVNHSFLFIYKDPKGIYHRDTGKFTIGKNNKCKFISFKDGDFFNPLIQDTAIHYYSDTFKGDWTLFTRDTNYYQFKKFQEKLKYQEQFSRVNEQLIAVPNLPFERVLDIFNFDKEFADSLLMVKIGQTRQRLNLIQFVPSSAVSKFISNRNCGIMNKKIWLHHPPVTEEITSKYKLIEKFHRNNGWEPNGIEIYSEVAHMNILSSSQVNTYIDLINSVINGWWNSLPHRRILLSEEFGGSNFLLGVAIQQDLINPNRFWATANVIGL